MRTLSSNLPRQSGSTAAGSLPSSSGAALRSCAEPIEKAVTAVLRQRTYRRSGILALSVAILALGGAVTAQAQTTINISTLGNSGTYTQNFSGLSGAGTSAAPVFVSSPENTGVDLSNATNFAGASSSVAGWYAAETVASGAGVNEIIYGTDNGAGNRGSVYNYGGALGTVASGTATFEIGALFTNNTGSTVTSITIQFTGQEFRNGGGTNVVNTLTFGYDVGASNIGGSGFTADTNLNYSDSTHGGSASGTVLSGAATNPVVITETITGLTWTSGSTLAIRWADNNDAGNDDGVAISNFSLTAQGVSSQYWNPNGASGIGGSGTWDTTSSIWNSKVDASGTSSVFSSTLNAVFGGTAGTATIVVGGVTANGGIEFSSNGYIINGTGTETLTLGSASGGNAIGVDNAGDTATINAQILGASGLVKSGGGTLVLGNSNNSFTGSVQIRGGVLVISNDGQLGDPANSIVFGGGALNTTATITTSRSFSGAAALNIASGTTLTVMGSSSFNTTALTLSNSGTLDLEDSTTSVGAVTFTAPGKLTSGNTITATGLDATNLTGTATISSPSSEGLILGAGTLTVNVGAAGDLVLDAPLTLTGNTLSPNTSLKKTGAGALELTQDNPQLWRVQIGTASTATGGLVKIGSPNALGQNQLFFNFGTLQATTDLTGVNAINEGVLAGSAPMGVSIGGLDGAPAIFAGSNMEFDGPSSIFQSATVGSHITVNNTTILGGPIILGGTGPSPKLTVDGTGTLVFTEDASAMIIPTTVSGSATLFIQSSRRDGDTGNGAWAAPTTVASTTATLHVGATGIVAAPVNVNSGKLVGTGTLAGVTVGDGAGSKDAVLSPGEPGATGAMTVSSLSLNSDALFQLTLNTTTHATSFINDTGALTLTGSPVLSLTDLGGATLPIGTQFVFLQYGTFGGGQFSDPAGDSLTEGAMFSFGANEFQITYDGGASHNEVILTAAAVPEPSAIAALAWGCAAMAGLGRFRRKASPAS